MAEDNARDMAKLRKLRSAAASVHEVLLDKGIHLRADDSTLLYETKARLEKRAEQIEAVWN